MRLKELDDGCERKEEKKKEFFSTEYNCCDGVNDLDCQTVNVYFRLLFTKKKEKKKNNKLQITNFTEDGTLKQYASQKVPSILRIAKSEQNEAKAGIIPKPAQLVLSLSVCPRHHLGSSTTVDDDQLVYSIYKRLFGSRAMTLHNMDGAESSLDFYTAPFDHL